jgi:hypothetical protein
MPVSPPLSNNSATTATTNNNKPTTTTPTARDSYNSTLSSDISGITMLTTEEEMTMTSPSVTSTMDHIISTLAMPDFPMPMSDTTSPQSRRRKSSKKTVRELMEQQQQQQQQRLPSSLPFLDASRSTNLVFLNTPPPPPTSESDPYAATAAAVAAVAAPPLTTTTTTPPTTAETKMKRAIQEHKESMESRLSKLRQINNNNQQTPATAASSSLASPPISRTLFVQDMEDTTTTTTTASLEKVLERQLSQQMQILRESLMETIQDTTHTSVEDNLSDWRALLDQKLETHLEQVSSATAASSQHCLLPKTSSSPRRSSSFSDWQVLEDLMERRMQVLETMMVTNTQKLEKHDAQVKEHVATPLQLLLAALGPKLVTIRSTSADEDDDEEEDDQAANLPTSIVLSQVRSIVDKRMDSMESLVQSTATTLEATTKASQQRLNQELLDQVLEAIEALPSGMKRTQQQPQQQQQQQLEHLSSSSSHFTVGNESVATSAFPTIYRDDDDNDDDDYEQRFDLPMSKNPAAPASTHGHRSLEADLVAMDRQASIRDIYGDLDIDDGSNAPKEVVAAGGVRGSFAEGVVTGRSLRDLCNIDTIAEEDDDDSGRHSDSAQRGDESTHSEVTARSLSVRNIYGDRGMDIDDNNIGAFVHHMSLPAFRAFDAGHDAPPVMARRSISLGTISTGLSEDIPWTSDDDDGDDQSDVVDNTLSLVDPAGKKNRIPPMVGRSESLTVDRLQSLESPTVLSRSLNAEAPGWKDKAPSLTSRVISTRAIYGEADIEEPGTRSGHNIIPAKSIHGIYDDVDIDIFEGEKQIYHSAIDSADVYDDLSLDGVEETRAFVDALDDPLIPSGESEDEDEDEDEDDAEEDQMSVSIDTAGAADIVESLGNNETENSEPRISFISMDSSGDAGDKDKILGNNEAENSEPRISFVSMDSSGGAGDIGNSLGNTEAGDSEPRISFVSTDSSGGYDSLSGVDKARAFVDAVNDPDMPSDKENKNEDEDDQMSVSIDGDSIPLSVSSGHDSDSSFDDEEFFRDRERQPLTVLATAMGKIRAAKKGARHYKEYQENVLVANRAGPLALKVKSFSERSIDDEGVQKMAMSDGSSGDGSGRTEQGQSSDAGVVAEDEDVGSCATESDRGKQRQDRPKESAFIVATAVAKSRAAKRAIRVYRQLIESKFTPRSKQGPTAIVDQSESTVNGADESGRGTDSATPMVRQEDDVASDESVPDITPGIRRRSLEQQLAAIPLSICDGLSLEKQRPTWSVSARVPSPENATQGGEASNKQGISHAPVHERKVNRKPVYAAFDNDGETMQQEDAELQSDMATLARTQMMAADSEQARPDDVWHGIAVDSMRRSPGEGSPPRSMLHEAEAKEEEGAFKPEDLTKLPSSKNQNQSLDTSRRPFDESEGDFLDATANFATASTVHLDMDDVPGEEMTVDPTDLEMEEWAAVGTPESVPTRRAARTSVDSGESKEEAQIVEQVLLVDHIHDIRMQMQNWKEVFLTSSHDLRTSNDTLRLSNDMLTATNEKLQTSVQESIEDSHHFAAYLDKMLTERIEQLEITIREQSAAIASQALLAARNETVTVLNAAGATPPRARSAPASPMHSTWTSSPLGIARMNPFGAAIEEEGKETDAPHEAIASMMVTVTEWKRLQDKLRGTEEVAESYRKQVLQLRNVLEVKINEGNASQHQVEVLQRKLQEAYDREVQAQKQLRPVTRRVEQVIQEMVELEELSSTLQDENGRLREQLWMAQREC